MASIVTYEYIKQNPDIMEYIRRACEEKIERDKIENRITVENIRMQPESEKELRQLITKIVREVLSEEK